MNPDHYRIIKFLSDETSEDSLGLKYRPTQSISYHRDDKYYFNNDYSNTDLKKNYAIDRHPGFDERVDNKRSNYNLNPPYFRENNQLANQYEKNIFNYDSYENKKNYDYKINNQEQFDYHNNIRSSEYENQNR